MDRFLLAGFDGTRATLNLGGISNITVATNDGDLHCYDIGPGDAFLDAAAVMYSDGTRTFDRDGAMSSQDKVHNELLALLQSEPFFDQEPPKSTGKELFNLDYLQQRLAKCPHLRDVDVLATLAELTAHVVAAECRRWDVRTVVGSGGGMLNRDLVSRLRVACAPAEVLTSEAVGLPITAVEAYTITVLGYLSVSGLHAISPQATGGSRASLMGSMTPGVTQPRFAQLDKMPASLSIRGAGG